MPSVPVTKASRLIDALNDLAREGRRNDIALANIRRQAEALRAHDRSGACMVLGAISSLLGDEKAMHRYHLASLECAANKGDAYFNYATSLIFINNYSGALELLQNAYALEPSPMTLGKMVFCAKNLGLHSLADNYLRELGKIMGEKAPDDFMPPTKTLRSNVMEMLEQDILEHGDLWKDLAKV